MSGSKVAGKFELCAVIAAPAFRDATACVNVNAFIYSIFMLHADGLTSESFLSAREIQRIERQFAMLEKRNQPKRPKEKVINASIYKYHRGFSTFLQSILTTSCQLPIQGSSQSASGAGDSQEAQPGEIFFSSLLFCISSILPFLLHSYLFLNYHHITSSNKIFDLCSFHSCSRKVQASED
jgi:hypothetical protein